MLSLRVRERCHLLTGRNRLNSPIDYRNVAGNGETLRKRLLCHRGDRVDATLARCDIAEVIAEHHLVPETFLMVEPQSGSDPSVCVLRRGSPHEERHPRQMPNAAKVDAELGD